MARQSKHHPYDLGLTVTRFRKNQGSTGHQGKGNVKISHQMWGNDIFVLMACGEDTAWHDRTVIPLRSQMSFHSVHGGRGEK